MSRQLRVVIVLVVLVAAGCGRLGVGLPGCEPVVRNPTTANILALQAVPSADYAPCVNALKLGWDDIGFAAENGRATLEIGREYSPFLTVSVTESCDIGDAVEVASHRPSITRYEDIEAIGTDIRVTVIPTGERPLIHARTMVEDLARVRVDDRPVIFTINEAVDFSVLTRVNEALFTDQYVWIISDLDIEEDTLELRRTTDGEGARGLSVHQALDAMERNVPDTSYKGSWFLVFNGGCITYEFDATGTVAETLEQDVAEAIGLYPNEQLRQAARDMGYEIESQ